MLDGNIPYQVKVVNSYLVAFVNWIPIVDWYIGVASRMDAKKTCSKYGNHPRLNRQYNWEDLDDHLMSTILFTLIMA